MKFGKRLKRQMEETLPEWRDKFLSYKDLKKLVRLISVAARPSTRAAESEFMRLLDAEIDKFNAFFVEQEEDFIIRQKLLHDRINNLVVTSKAEYMVEIRRIHKDIVNFHGEMVLLVNYSSINYTGLAKILKKYDKQTGGLLRSPIIDKVLTQPFFTTDIISKLIKECETTMESVFPAVQRQQLEPSVERETAIATTGQSIYRSTVAALTIMQELRKGTSTYGHFSLPPLSLPDTDLLQSLGQLPLPSPIAIQ